LHGIASNTALKPASVYNWNGVYRPRLQLLGGFLASGIHRQCAFLPSHKAMISIMLVSIFAARWQTYVTWTYCSERLRTLSSNSWTTY